MALNVCQASLDVEPDNDVDLADFAAFQQCFTGKDGSLTLPNCTAFDTNCDGDVDLGDHGIFWQTLMGP